MIETIKMFFVWLQEIPPLLLILIIGAVFTLTMINAGIILPLIFNFMIIPKIKKRVGRELEYHSSINSRRLFWKFLWPCLEISQYIFFQYLTKKTKVNFAKLINSDFALKRINYNINQSSRFEIVMSCITMFNAYLFILCGIIILLLGHYYNIH